MNDPTRDNTANQWLLEACEVLDIDYEGFKAVIPDLLDLTRDVAHGPSRPAAPLTAFLVGVAAGRDGAQLPEHGHDRVAQITERLRADGFLD